MKPGEIVKLSDRFESIPIWTEQWGLDKRKRWIPTPRRPEIVRYLQKGDVALIIGFDEATRQTLILIPPGTTGWIAEGSLKRLIG